MHTRGELPDAVSIDGFALRTGHLFKHTHFLMVKELGGIFYHILLISDPLLDPFWTVQSSDPYLPSSHWLR